MNIFADKNLSHDDAKQPSNERPDVSQPTRTFLGHPPGLFVLFFAEMWERFSYYGMRALLIFYMTKGFLGYGDKEAYSVYGAYTALVYMTPFFGGIISDRLIGPRLAVIIGGLLMALGHLMMAIEQDFFFFTALALLIVGNGFFKPNISSMVGSLYPEGSPKRDGGFTIFYIGINLGAAMSPLLCGFIGETYGWHYGFGLATLGMLIGLAVFVAPTLPSFLMSDEKLHSPAGNALRLATRIIAMALIGVAAIVSAVALLIYHPDDWFSTTLNSAIALCLVAGAFTSILALTQGGLPESIGWPKNPAKLPFHLFAVLVGTLVSIPIFSLLVSGFSIVREKGKGPFQVIGEAFIEGIHKKGGFNEAIATILEEISKPAGLILALTGIVSFGYLIVESFRQTKVGRDRMIVVLTLTFFSMLFWAFFEQAGSSVNNFTDRNIDRVGQTSTVSADQVGETIKLIPTQEQLGFERGSYVFTQADFDLRKEEAGATMLWMVAPENVGQTFTLTFDKAKLEEELAESKSENEVMGLILSAMTGKQITITEELVGKPIEVSVSQDLVGRTVGQAMFTLTHLEEYRKAVTPEPMVEIDWQLVDSNVGMGLAPEKNENKASVFQAVNPGFILIFGIVFTILWSLLAKMKLEPSTPVKFSLGLIQLGLGFGCFYLGAANADERGMVSVMYLILGYFFQTTGELCLSPVGLSMVTKLSPKALVSTVMGGWFLATAMSQYLAAIFSQFTRVEGGEGGVNMIPAPIETVDVYGGVFGKIAIAAMICGAFCLVLSPLLSKMMHVGVDEPEKA